MKIAFLIIVILFAALGSNTAAVADTVTDCKAVDDDATASAKAGFTVGLATAGKTCTFSVDGSGSSGSSGNASLFEQSLGQLSRAATERFPVGAPDVFNALVSPFLQGPAPDDLLSALQGSNLFGENGFFPGCLTGNQEYRQSEVSNSFVAGCGFVRDGADVTLSGTEGRVIVGGDAGAVLSLRLADGSAYYLIVGLDRLYQAAQR